VERGGTGQPHYHRLESPTQPRNIVSIQQQSGTIRGYPALGSHIPRVKAYDDPLSADARGLEFTTDVFPDDGCAPGRPVWSGPRDRVRIRTDEQGREFAEISIVIRNITQT
jgi:hypothetical protein